MDKTKLVADVAHLFQLTGHIVQVSVKINHREIDVVAQERQGLIRKTILVECADYGNPVGVDKVDTDIRKLATAREAFAEGASLLHVSANGYTPEANGLLRQWQIPGYTISTLQANLINFEPYVSSVEADRLRPVILREYQPTRLYYESQPNSARAAVDFVSKWLSSKRQWLTVLGTTVLVNHGC